MYPMDYDQCCKTVLNNLWFIDYNFCNLFYCSFRIIHTKKNMKYTEHSPHKTTTEPTKKVESA